MLLPCLHISYVNFTQYSCDITSLHKDLYWPKKWENRVYSPLHPWFTLRVCVFTQQHLQRDTFPFPSSTAWKTSLTKNKKTKRGQRRGACGSVEPPGASRCMDSAVACHFGDNWSALRDRCLPAIPFPSVGLCRAQESWWVRENVVGHSSTHIQYEKSVYFHSHLLYF